MLTLGGVSKHHRPAYLRREDTVSSSYPPLLPPSPNPINRRMTTKLRWALHQRVSISAETRSADIIAGGESAISHPGLSIGLQRALERWSTKKRTANGCSPGRSPCARPEVGHRTTELSHASYDASSSRYPPDPLTFVLSTHPATRIGCLTSLRPRTSSMPGFATVSRTQVGVKYDEQNVQSVIVPSGGGDGNV